MKFIDIAIKKYDPWCDFITFFMNSENETSGRSRHQNNRRRVVRNLEEQNVGTREKSPRQGLTSAEALIIMLLESTNIRDGLIFLHQPYI